MSELMQTTGDGDAPRNATPEVISLSFEHGWNWLIKAWELFIRAPLMWIAFVVVVMVIFSMVSIIPVLGHIAVNLFWPVFIGGIMAGCAALDEGEELEFEHLLAGFNDKLKPLLILGAAYLGMMLIVVAVVLVLAFLLGFGMTSMFTGTESAAADPQSIFLILMIMLIMMALMVPVAMATWFAPTLIMLGNHDVLDAIKLSFQGCLKNILPFLLYGFIVLILAFAAVVTLFLGFAVLLPVISLSVYAAYREIYKYN